MNNTGKYHLEELKGSDYAIVDEEPNIQGWTIRNAKGQKVGKVRDMLFDTDSLTVRYIISDLKHNEVDLSPKEVLLPMGLVSLDTDNKEVLLQRVEHTYLQNAPGYEYGALNPQYEADIYGLYTGDANVPLESYNPDTFYNNEFFENEYYSKKKG